MLVSYNDSMTMREARTVYFEANQFGANGGYDDAWVDFKLGPVPMPFKNTAARVRAVRFHDLHHILTGFDTDIVGEFEISAWEIAAGCKGFVAAWMLNLGGMAAGLFRAPARTFRAFVRGRRDRSLYGLEFEPLLEKTVRELRDAQLQRPASAGVLDVLWFVIATLAGLVVGAIVFALVLVFLPLGLVNQMRRQARP
jgi:hypothetical protein